MNIKRPSKIRLLWIATAITIILAGFICINTYMWLPIVFGNHDGTLKNFTVKQIGDFVGIDIPESATNLHYEGQNINDGLIVLLDLNFDAPNSEAEEFARHFCQGVLFENFDPFSYGRLHKFPIYKSPSSVKGAGSDCSSPGDAPGKISIVGLGMAQSHVHLQYRQCNSYCPSWYRAKQLSPDFAVILTGYNGRGGSSPKLPTLQFICIGLIPTFAAGQPDGTMSLKGTRIKMSIDHFAIPPAYVNANGLLEPSYDFHGPRIVRPVAGKPFSPYCNYIKLLNSPHTFSLQIFKPSIPPTKYTWQVQS
jgi:hypothetical protein